MITDNIQRKFLADMQQTAEREFQSACHAIKENFSLNLSAASDGLYDQMKQMLTCYKLLEKEDQAGELQYIYISYMRSRILREKPCYQVDFYDARNRVSDMECTGNWSFESIFNYLYEIREHLKSEFKKQSKVGDYELDRITYQLADHFHDTAKIYFPAVIEDCLQRHGTELLSGCVVTFMFGEYLDKSNRILIWDSDKVIIET